MGLDDSDLDPDLLEFLVDQRLINGRQTMLIDTQRCTRCDDCVQACSKTHRGNPRFIRNGPQFKSFQFAHACMHCVDPVCMIGCPTGAIARDIETGVVSINPNSCIGCKTCSESCPYDNIVMVQINDAKAGCWWIRRLSCRYFKRPNVICVITFQPVPLVRPLVHMKRWYESISAIFNL